MLVLSRKQQEKIRIGNDIVITVLRMKGKAVRLGIEAPGEVPVLRGELVFSETDEENETAPAEQAEVEVSLDRVPRNLQSQVIPHLVDEAGPLRSMLNSRTVAR